LPYFTLDCCKEKTRKPPRSGQTYTRYLLRESYREEGKVKHRTIANLSHCSPQEIEAIRLALRHKENLQALTPADLPVVLQQGPSIGAVWSRLFHLTVTAYNKNRLGPQSSRFLARIICNY
jgi:hypothetical protein